MKKKIKKNNRIDYNALEVVRVNIVEHLVKYLNDDACRLSSCEIRKYILDYVEL